jgi:hypothetical protein
MNVGELLVSMLPAVARLAVDALVAIASGKPDIAARKAEEAARRQAVKLLADAALRAAAKAKKAGRK